MAVEISSSTLIVSVMPAMAVTAFLASDCIAPTCWVISWVAVAVWVARFLTSEATTAKPLPASPA